MLIQWRVNLPFQVSKSLKPVSAKRRSQNVHVLSGRSDLTTLNHHASRPVVLASLGVQYGLIYIYICILIYKRRNEWDDQICNIMNTIYIYVYVTYIYYL